MPGGTEFFYEDENGEKQDDWLHEEILAGGDDDAMREISKDIARKVGLSEEQIAALFKPRATKTKAYVKRDEDDYIQDPKTGLMQGRKPGGGATAPSEKPAAGKSKKGKAKIDDFKKADIRIDPEIEGDEDKKLSFEKRWNEAVGEAPEDFKRQFLGGMPGSMRISYNERPDAMHISGYLKDKDGRDIAEYSRDIDLDDKHAYSAYFKVKEGVRGGGIGKKLLAGNVEMYQKMGLDRVRVSANIDVGGYAWARYGYVPTPSGWDSLKSGYLKGRLANLERRLTGASSEPAARRAGVETYTPDEWAVISDDDQERIYEAWARSTRDDFIESEVQSWHDNGGSTDDAKNEMAHQFDGNDRWAKVAMNEWRDEETAIAQIPFSNEQILSAVNIKYEGDGEGRNDPEIEWDDTKLEKPPGFDPSQLHLPGIEKPYYPSLLTEEMRGEIEAKLVKAFNNEAESRAPDMEPPSHLSEYVDEYQGDYWQGMEDRERFRWAERNGELPEYEIEVDASSEEPPEPEPQKEMELAKPAEMTALEALKKLVASDDPKAIWKIADSKYGKEMLLNTSWPGVINFSDKETMNRFNAYVHSKD